MPYGLAVPIPFVDELRAWYHDYERGGGRRNVRVDFTSGPEDRPKRAAWIVVHGKSAAGQVTLWESGECETEAAGTAATGEAVPLLLRSRVLANPDLVKAVADDLIDHVADYSGT
jgi:hypothetical protein